MTNPRVSVVAAVFNGERDVEAACRSVLCQSYLDVELLVVDDASTDETPHILERLSAEDNRLRSVRNSVQLGQTWSLNRGLELSRGDFIARIDADDLFRPEKLERQVEYLDGHPDVTVVGTWAMRIAENGDAVGLFRAPVATDDIDFGLLHSSPLCHVSVLMRRAAVLGVGGYRGEYRYAADFKLWSDLRRAGCRLANIPEVLVDYRVAASTFSGASRLGTAADEAASIIQGNASSFCGIELSLSVCRAIHLRSEERSGLSASDRRAAFLVLGEMARRHFGRVPSRLRARLLAGAVWSFAVGARTTRGNMDALPTSAGVEIRNLRLAGLGAAERLGRLSSWIGLGRLSRVSAVVRRNLGA